MRKLLIAVFVLLLTAGLWAQTAPSATDDAPQLRQEIDQLKKTINLLEQRLDKQESAAKAATAQTPATQPAATQPLTSKDEAVVDLQTSVRDLNERMNQTERRTLRDRLDWGGDYRFEAHTIWGGVPNHYDGMQLQNLMVKAMWFAGSNGYTPSQMVGLLSSPTLPNGQPNTPANFAALVNGAVASNYSSYQYFTNNLTFSSSNPSSPGLKQMIGAFTPAQQQAFMAYLMQVPGVYQAAYSANTDALLTNRLRLKFETRVADNVSFGARLSMYKVFGDSTGVQVFNGQPNSLNIDGTTAGVPNSDQVRVERVFFNWNNIAGSKLYLSIGRRPANYGPPLNFRDDDLRGGTPSGALFDFQYDGMTVGYHVTPKMTLRACYGLGYSSGWGNANLIKNPADRLKDVHLAGGVLDLYETDHTFVQALFARAWNVTDGFNGLVVMPNNPLTGDAVPAPVVMRYTPSANLGAIDLYGVVVEKKLRQFDLYASVNWDSLRPNGLTTPFGGLGSDPFSTPTNHDGQMYYAGVRYAIPKGDGRTKIGFEFNHGTKYWFNFSNAEDDIIAPKTNTRGGVYETFLTHRISDHFLFKADYIRYNYTWSGSGWHIGEPKRLSATPLLGFPGYDKANMVTAGLTAEF
jgi:hypothetical protein